MKGTMEIMGEQGDVKVEWDSDVKAETEIAEKVFKENVKKGFKPFRMTKSGGKGEEIDAFDKFAERILFVPPLVGG